MADLEKSKALDDHKFDPYVREGDEITIPFSNKEFDVISISGAVYRPSVVAYKTGDKASLLLKLGYGLRENADMENITLIIPGDFGDRNEFKLEVTKDMKLIGQDYDLVPGSSIIVGRKKKATKGTQGIVSVIGNVQKEGSYLIKPNTTTISEVIEMAGGFTDEAYLPQSYILRREVNELGIEDQRRKVLNEFFMKNLNRNDYVYTTTVLLDWDGIEQMLFTMQINILNACDGPDY
jgi:protein involved in polysaccharide export with SLBB domain